VSHLPLAAERPTARIAGLAFTIACAPALLWFGNPALALIAAAAASLVLGRPVVDIGERWGKFALQGAIVLVALRLDVGTVLALSAEFSWTVAACVLATLATGLLLARVLATDPITGKLLSAGTAICGGTAIATLSPLLGATAGQTGVALAIVFLLNAVALFVFPLIGQALDLSELQFGLWTALAIHDTSSVVATATVYGEQAAEVAATVKLGRTLWLIPLVFLAGAFGRGDSARARFPGFVAAFVAASAIGTWIALPDWAHAAAGTLSKALLVVALFLIGARITRSALAEVRGRVVAHALILWSIVAPATLGAVLWVT
jgi:uncharacterized membrane protein YadS